jgi:hypothetical protein
MPRTLNVTITLKTGANPGPVPPFAFRSDEQVREWVALCLNCNTNRVIAEVTPLAGYADLLADRDRLLAACRAALSDLQAPPGAEPWSSEAVVRAAILQSTGEPA